MLCSHVAQQIFQGLLPLIFVPPGAFQNLHLNVIAGSVILSSSPAPSEAKLQLSSNCPFMYPLKKGWDCFLLSSRQNFCWYTGEQYLVLILRVASKMHGPQNQSQMSYCGGMNFVAGLGSLLWGIQTIFCFFVFSYFKKKKKKGKPKLSRQLLLCVMTSVFRSWLGKCYYLSNNMLH